MSECRISLRDAQSEAQGAEGKRLRLEKDQSHRVVREGSRVRGGRPARPGFPLSGPPLVGRGGLYWRNDPLRALLGLLSACREVFKATCKTGQKVALKNADGERRRRGEYGVGWAGLHQLWA